MEESAPVTHDNSMQSRQRLVHSFTKCKTISYCNKYRNIP